MEVKEDVCVECGFNHDIDAVSAIMWHKQHPCPHCKFDREKGTHQPNCPTQSILRGGRIVTEARQQCAECPRTVKNGYRLCYTCMKASRRK